MFKNVNCEIVSNNDFRLNNALTTTIKTLNNEYLILISEKVYDGANELNIGGYRMHIMHEICHVILFKIGFKPNLEKVYKNKKLKAYESIEWQAKALAGEILIPYSATIDMTLDEIVKECKVSKEAALFRINCYNKKIQ